MSTVSLRKPETFWLCTDIYDASKHMACLAICQYILETSIWFVSKTKD
jgi:hypothetical protein